MVACFEWALRDDDSCLLPPSAPTSTSRSPCPDPPHLSGIGLAIALAAAKDGANIAVVAKTTVPQAKLAGTIYTAVDEINKAGGRGLAIECDIRFEDQVKKAIDITVKHFGGLDILVNNASAIRVVDSEQLTMKEYDLMQTINTRGTFLCSKYAIPHLKKAAGGGKILNLSPPLSMRQQWFAPHTAYTIAKFGMSMCVLGMAGELKECGIAVNALWPLTTIATAAVQVSPVLVALLSFSTSPLAVPARFSRSPRARAAPGSLRPPLHSLLLPLYALPILRTCWAATR